MAQRIVMVLAVAVLVATIVVVSSTEALARPLRGGVPLHNEKLCEKLADKHPRFELRALISGGPPAPPDTVCWHVSPGLLVATGEEEPPPPR